MLNVPAGTYRVRFAHEGFYTFEKELDLARRHGRAGDGRHAERRRRRRRPPPPPPPAEPAKSDLSLPPPWQPKTMALPDYIERTSSPARKPQKENLVGCSGVGQSVLWQVREPWADRQHDSADAHDLRRRRRGPLRLGRASEFTVAAGSFAVVPRGTSYSFTRRGRNPLIVLAILAGAPCAGN